MALFRIAFVCLVGLLRLKTAVFSQKIGDSFKEGLGYAGKARLFVLGMSLNPAW